MKNKILFFVFAVSVALSFTSCKEDVNISNMDTAAEIDMNLAVPVGTISATFGDFIGLSNGYLQVDDEGVLYIKDTVPLNKQFHKIDLTNYISSVSANVSIADYATGTIPAGIPFSIEHTFTLTLNGINTELSTERIDSIYIASADFIATLNVSNFNLPFSDLASVELVLPACIHRAAGSVISVPLAGKNYGQEIPIQVEDFYINLMADPTQAPSINNVLNSVDFTIRYSILTSAPVEITNDSKFNFGLKIQLIDYNAIWGYFAPDNTMHDSDTIVIEDEWAGWKNMKNAKLQLSDPMVELFMWHYMGMPLVAKLGSLKAVNKTGLNSASATFGADNRPNGEFYLNNFVDPRSPLNAPYFYGNAADSINYFLFDKQPENGHLDNMFAVNPDYLIYDFSVEINPDARFSDLNQYRITPNDTLYLDAVATIPFKFNPNVAVEYTDTLKDLSFNLAIDTLTHDIAFVDSLLIDSVKLIMEAVSYIPFNIHVDFTFLDENNQPLEMDIFEGLNEYIDIPTPAYVEQGVVITPSRSSIVIRLDNERLEQLSKVRAVKYNAYLGRNAVYSEIHTDTQFKINIGLAASVDAFLHLDAFNE